MSKVIYKTRNTEALPQYVIDAMDKGNVVLCSHYDTFSLLQNLGAEMVGEYEPYFIIPNEEMIKEFARRAGILNNIDKYDEEFFRENILLYLPYNLQRGIIEEERRETHSGRTNITLMEEFGADNIIANFERGGYILDGFIVALPIIDADNVFSVIYSRTFNGYRYIKLINDGERILENSNFIMTSSEDLQKYIDSEKDTDFYKYNRSFFEYLPAVYNEEYFESNMLIYVNNVFPELPHVIYIEEVFETNDNIVVQICGVYLYTASQALEACGFLIEFPNTDYDRLRVVTYRIEV